MNKNIKKGMVLAVSAIVLTTLVYYVVKRNASNERLVETKPVRGEIKHIISTVGAVKPQNRLEIKPPIGGRIEKIFVSEGQEVKTGDILALMSSTERATLMDAARLKGKKEFEYWQKIYKETPLVAPIDGVVIVRNVEPGQTVTTADAIMVLSNRLIVEADMDETDIGETKLRQKAVISLDAYPDIKINATVDHISYESEVVNNVTIYKVDILPVEVPSVFRSGMSANVDIIVDESKDAILVPSEALIHKGEDTYLYVKNSKDGRPEEKAVITGMEEDGIVEIKSGVSDDDIIFVKKNSYVAPEEKDNGTNPFLPRFRGRQDKDRK